MRMQVRRDVRRRYIQLIKSHEMEASPCKLRNVTFFSPPSNSTFVQDMASPLLLISSRGNRKPRLANHILSIISFKYLSYMLKTDEKNIQIQSGRFWSIDNKSIAYGSRV